MATQSELESLEDACAICWERMEAARKLPCKHAVGLWLLVARGEVPAG